ncbi:MAG: hypothetical protein RL235_625 [Chlamydiota bacterium]|jgi:hypothetical protein
MASSIPPYDPSLSLWLDQFKHAIEAKAVAEFEVPGDLHATFKNWLGARFVGTDLRQVGVWQAVNRIAKEQFAELMKDPAACHAPSRQDKAKDRLDAVVATPDASNPTARDIPPPPPPPVAFVAEVPAIVTTEAYKTALPVMEVVCSEVLNEQRKSGETTKNASSGWWHDQFMKKANQLYAGTEPKKLEICQSINLVGGHTKRFAQIIRYMTFSIPQQGGVPIEYHFSHSGRRATVHLEPKNAQVKEEGEPAAKRPTPPS